MKTRTFLPIVAVLFAAFTLPTQTVAQSTNVKTPNKNQSAKFKSAIFKGSGNLIQSNSVTSFIGAGQSNSVLSGADYAVLGGGFKNVVLNDSATVSGGAGNTASGAIATVGGGEGNTASGPWSAVAGGQLNTAGTNYATVGGGSVNTNSGFCATLGGGELNKASADYATVGGGAVNTASGNWATVPGGTHGKATHTGSFVWSGYDDEDTESFGVGTFTVRCHGGARFYSAPGTGTAASLPPGGTSFAALSDSNSKTDFRPIEPREILSKVAALPVTAWHYKHDPQRLYIGPMAQDFRAAFGLGYDDKSISTLDSDGVMYAAIQGLVEELKDRDKTIEELKAWSMEQGARSKAEVDELKAKLEAVEQRLNSLPPAP